MTWLLHFWHTMYVPSAGPFYDGQVWGNVFVVAVLAPLGWLWSRTKFWPLRPLHRQLERVHAKLDEHRTATSALQARVEALHARHDGHARALEQLAGRVEELHERLPARRKRGGA